MKNTLLRLLALGLGCLLLGAAAPVGSITFLGVNPAFDKDGNVSGAVQINYSLTAEVDGLATLATRTVSFDLGDKVTTATVDGITLTPAQWWAFAEQFAAAKVPAKKAAEAAAKAAAAVP